MTKYTALGPELERVYKDGQKIARRWFNRAHYGKRLEDRSLASFLDFIGEAPPPYLGTAVTTKRLRDVRQQLGVGYDELTPVDGDTSQMVMMLLRSCGTWAA